MKKILLGLGLKTTFGRDLAAKKLYLVTEVSKMEYSMQWVRNGQPVRSLRHG